MSVNSSTNPLLSMPQKSVFDLTYEVFDVLLAQTDKSVRQYLQLHQPTLSLDQIDEWLAPCAIFIDAIPSDKEDKLKHGQMLTIELKDHFEQKVNTHWESVWQNDEIIAINKPAPLAVSRTTRNLHDTLIGLVRRQTPYCKAQLLHRLDIETSGLILLAKDKNSDIKWKKNLKSLIEKKVYHAIVKGVPQWHEHTLDNQLAERVDSQIRCKMFVVDESLPSSTYKKPKQSKTVFKRLKTQGEYSLIECQLLTGRKHQIRAHLAHLGLPIVGDKIYSQEGMYFLKRLESTAGLTESDYLSLGAENHLLRAVELGLRLCPDEDLIMIRSPSFKPQMDQEIFPLSKGNS